MWHQVMKNLQVFNCLYRAQHLSLTLRGHVLSLVMIFLFCFVFSFLFFLKMCLLFYYFLRFYLFIFREKGRGGEREGEKHQCVIASHTPPTGDLAHNPGICPDWGSNQRPFGSQACTQSTELYQPGLFFSIRCQNRQVP